jgi:ElaB/YqjD/DUF883 family membrane-anchored ribosome-binding protein
MSDVRSTAGASSSEFNKHIQDAGKGMENAAGRSQDAGQGLADRAQEAGQQISGKLKSSADDVRKQASEMADKAGDYAQEASDRASDLYRQAGDYYQTGQNAALGAVHAQPLTSLGVAALIGFLVGLLLARS